MELERASGAHGEGRWAHTVGSTISAEELEASGKMGGESSAVAAMAAAGQNQRVAKLREQLQRNMGQGWGMEPRLLDVGGIAIAEALKANTSLTALCLSGNGLRRPTATALVRSMGVNLELRHSLTDLECDLSHRTAECLPSPRPLSPTRLVQPLAQLHRGLRRRRPRGGVRRRGRGQDSRVRAHCILGAKAPLSRASAPSPQPRRSLSDNDLSDDEKFDLTRKATGSLSLSV